MLVVLILIYVDVRVVLVVSILIGLRIMKYHSLLTLTLVLIFLNKVNPKYYVFNYIYSIGIPLSGGLVIIVEPAA